MEEKSHPAVVVDLTLPAAFPTAVTLPASENADSLLQLGTDFARSALPGDAGAAVTTGAALVTGAAFSVVSFRVFKSKSPTTVFQSRSLAKDMTYLGVLYGAAELSQQLLNNCVPKRDNYNNDASSASMKGEPPPSTPPPALNFSSAKNVALFGATMAAPVFHFWYRFLDARFVGTAPTMLIKKVALDQIFASSSVSALFLVAVPAFQGEAGGDLVGPDSLLRRKFLSVYLTGCAFWPAAQIVNFRFVPPQYRVAYLGFAAFLWTNVLCCFSRH